VQVHYDEGIANRRPQAVRGAARAVAANLHESERDSQSYGFALPSSVGFSHFPSSFCSKTCVGAPW
jgi:hypothetical protein